MEKLTNIEPYYLKYLNEKSKLSLLITRLMEVQMYATQRGEIDTAYSLIELIKKFREDLDEN